jgi:hypothetical protein
MITPEQNRILTLLRKRVVKLYVDKVARDILSVQPTNPKPLLDLFEACKAPEWLRKNGYKPVERDGPSLMWTKRRD